MQQRIREPIARRALDCVLETSSQYGIWIATVGVESQQPVRLYHQLQHLADALEAAANAPDIVVEFEKKDANLLVSCSIFSMCNLVASMQDGVTGERYQEINTIMRELYAVAIEFAADTVRLIPRLDGKKFLPEDVRKIIDAINAKVRSGTIRRMPPLTQPVLTSSGNSGSFPAASAAPPARSAPPGRGGPQGAAPAPRAPAQPPQQAPAQQAPAQQAPAPRQPAPAAPPAAAPAPQQNQFQQGAPQGIVSDKDYIGAQWSGGSEAAPRNPMPDRPVQDLKAPGIEGGACIEFGPGTSAEFGEPMPAQGAAEGDGVDDGFPVNMAVFTERVLRAQVEHDRELLDMALGAEEYRVAAVMMCSLTESVLLQLAIPRRRELDLRGTPDSWDLHNLLITFTRDPEIQMDRLTLERVLQGRKLLMPAEQLMQPRDPQQGEIEDMLGAIGRFLAHVGFAAGAQPAQ